MRPELQQRGGFTLVEVLAAVGILGGALFILLNTHYSALRLHEEMAATVERRQLIERVVSDANSRCSAAFFGVGRLRRVRGYTGFRRGAHGPRRDADLVPGQRHVAARTANRSGDVLRVPHQWYGRHGESSAVNRARSYRRRPGRLHAHRIMVA